MTKCPSGFCWPRMTGMETLGLQEPETASGRILCLMSAAPIPNVLAPCLTQTTPFTPQFFALTVRCLPVPLTVIPAPCPLTLAVLQKALMVWLDSVHLPAGFSTPSLAHVLYCLLGAPPELWLCTHPFICRASSRDYSTRRSIIQPAQQPPLHH